MGTNRATDHIKSSTRDLQITTKPLSHIEGQGQLDNGEGGLTMARRIVTAEEDDAYTGWRYVLSWRAGERRRIKQRTHRRERREAKQEIRDQLES